MGDIIEAIKSYTPSARMMFYVMIVYAVLLIIATVAWCVSLFLEVTKKRASKLSIKYGSADAKENKYHVGKLVLQGIVIAIAWTIFVIAF